MMAPETQKKEDDYLNSDIDDSHLDGLTTEQLQQKIKDSLASLDQLEKEQITAALEPIIEPQDPEIVAKDDSSFVGHHCTGCGVALQVDNKYSFGYIPKNKLKKRLKEIQTFKEGDTNFFDNFEGSEADQNLVQQLS
mmetsp:Transcript_15942/g.24660  ORF Transcript_15942/g.24660 Transcript_15942/m.24660 type:complete len:137 (-) Transcript_15942:1583-1993(-)